MNSPPLFRYFLLREARAFLEDLRFKGSQRRLIFSRPISLSLRGPLDKPRRWPLNTTDDTLRPRIPAISALLWVRYSRLNRDTSSLVHRGRTRELSVFLPLFFLGNSLLLIPKVLLLLIL
jgi:hypothetical protein